jgi:DNA-binding LacI/PurR family transcriptional regulator
LALEWPEINQYLDQPLTALRLDFESLAKNGVTILKKLVEGKKVKSGLTLPYTLIKRESVRGESKK